MQILIDRKQLKNSLI